MTLDHRRKAQQKLVQMWRLLQRILRQGVRTDWLVVPLTAFVVTRLLVFVAAYLGDVVLSGSAEGAFWHAHPQNLLLDIWARWDSGFYLDIAKYGYEFVPGEQSSVAFFPLYPLLMKGAALLTGDVVLAGVVVSHLCLIAALIYLYKLTVYEFDQDTAQRAVFYIAAFPTSFFFSMVYTESLFLLLSVAALYHARKAQWGAAGIFALLTSASRIPGVVMWGVIGLEWLRFHGWTFKSALRRSSWQRLGQALHDDWSGLLKVCAAPLGLLAYMFFLARTFGDPIAFWTTQAAWGREAIGPFAVVGRDWQIFASTADFREGFLYWTVPVDLAALIFGAVMAVFIWRRMGASYALFVLLGLVMPAFSGSGSMSRYLLVLFPVFMMLARFTSKPTAYGALLAGFSVLLGLFTTIFVNWVFVA